MIDPRTGDILESITDEFSALDRQWRFTYVNEQALDVIRRAKGEELTREEVLGKSFWEVFPEGVGSVFYEKYHEAMREQKSVHFEARSPFTDRWVEVHAYHAHLLENVHDAVIATDEGFTVTAWNKSAERTYGWRADEALGRNLRELILKGIDDEQVN